MNYYKTTEKFLYNYKPLRASIDNMKSQLEELEPLGMSAINYEGERTGSTNKINRATEDEALNIIHRKEILQQGMNKTIEKVKGIERGLNILDDVESLIIKMRYFEAPTPQWWEIASKANCSERWCREKRRIAINKISVMLFGVEVLDVVN